MARIKNNDLTRGLSGRIGQQLGFRQIDGDTEAFRRPGKRRRKGSMTQQENRDRFLEAVYYARAIIANPEDKAIYQAKATSRRSAYHLALSDFIKGPEIKSVKTEQYQGLIGDRITIRALDNFKVAAVTVMILDPDDDLIEQGLAVEKRGGIDWVYTATVMNPERAGSTVIVVANDMPGNVARKEVVL